MTGPLIAAGQTYFKMSMAAGCTEAQASLEVRDSVKHCSPFLKSLFLALVEEAPRCRQLPQCPPPRPVCLSKAGIRQHRTVGAL